jgi:hypothetical protein
LPRTPAHEGDRPENNQLHQPLYRTTFHRVHPSPDQTVQSINPARGDNRRESSSRLDGLGSTQAGGGWRVESGGWRSWPGVLVAAGGRIGDSRKRCPAAGVGWAGGSMASPWRVSRR